MGATGVQHVKFRSEFAALPGVPVAGLPRLLMALVARVTRIVPEDAGPTGLVPVVLDGEPWQFLDWSTSFVDLVHNVLVPRVETSTRWITLLVASMTSIRSC